MVNKLILNHVDNAISIEKDGIISPVYTNTEYLIIQKLSDNESETIYQIV